MPILLSRLRYSIPAGAANPNGMTSELIEEQSAVAGSAQRRTILNMNEASAFLRCSRSHLSNAIRGKLLGTPRLPCVRIGRRVLFRREALEEWVRRIQNPDDSSSHVAVYHP